MDQKNKNAHRRGFVLIELLIAISMLVIITAMVYGTFATVCDSAMTARSGSEVTRHRVFILRHFMENISAMYSEPYYGIQNDSQLYKFKGDESSIRFITSAPPTGSICFPGELKQVQYELTSGGDQLEDLNYNEFSDETSSNALKISEVPIFSSVFDESDLDSESGIIEPNSEYTAIEIPEIPLQTMEFRYFDGKEWQDVYDIEDYGHFPWCIEIRINFTEMSVEQYNTDVVVEGEDVEFYLIVPIAMGMGVSQESEIFSVMTAYDELAKGQSIDMQDGDINADGRGNQKRDQGGVQGRNRGRDQSVARGKPGGGIR